MNKQDTMFFNRFSQNKFLLLLFLLVAFAVDFFVAISSQIQGLVLIGGFESSILTFMVFMPSWLWLNRIMMFWFVLSLKSLIAAISNSFVSLALVAPN